MGAWDKLSSVILATSGSGVDQRSVESIRDDSMSVWEDSSSGVDESGVSLGLSLDIGSDSYHQLKLKHYCLANILEEKNILPRTSCCCSVIVEMLTMDIKVW